MPRAIEYGWASPNMFQGVDANDVGHEIERLIEKHLQETGKGPSKQSYSVLKVEDLVSHALATQSPLHKLFEWDDASAAKRYRKQQAASIVNNLCVVRNKKRTKTRAFAYVRHPDAPHKPRTLMRIDDAMARPETERQVVDHALKELAQWIGKYGAQRQLEFVGSTVEKLRRRIEAEYQATVFGR